MWIKKLFESPLGRGKRRQGEGLCVVKEKPTPVLTATAPVEGIFLGGFHGAGSSDTASKRPLVRSSLMTREIARKGLFRVETSSSGPNVPARPRLASTSS